ncbi:MAG: type 4a pilus biogenesis protein PilO [Psychromonas sp.]|nr:type 4a pilus biogenesis protein PilO [Psychromonas sp.]
MDINDLDFENIGSWPALYRGVFIALVCSMFAGVFYYNVTIPQWDDLKSVEAEEQTLKENFKVKAALSANLEAYRAQMVEINVIFKGLINKLPSKKEIASLLDDLSFIGGDNGLQLKSINWGAKKDGELSVEVPISIQVVGTYEQLGQFAADIAALPRIVILDDLRLTKGKKGKLTLNVIAKTYRYKGDRK